MTEIYIEKCREDAKLPSYAHDGDAGMDLYAAEDVIIEPGKSALVPVGIKMAIPYGYEVQIRPRSGVSLKTPLRIPNAPGTIDCGYRDEVNVIVYNDSFFQDEGLPLGLILFGMAGQFTFKSRFIYQWIYSVRHKESVLPLGFWIIAVIGSIMIITYGAIRHDWVLIIGQLGIFVSIRNIMIALKYDRKHDKEAD